VRQRTITVKFCDDPFVVEEEEEETGKGIRKRNVYKASSAVK
jgi:hypothetical protein